MPSTKAKKPVRHRDPHWDLQWDEQRVKEKIKYTRHYEPDAATWDCPEEMAKLTKIRKRREKVMRKTATKALKLIEKMLRHGMLCGSHWRNFKGDPWKYCRENTFLKHDFIYRESPEDMPESHDYFQLVVWVECPQYASPSIDIPKLLALFDKSTCTAHFCGSYLSMCVDYDEEFFHLDFCLNGKPEIFCADKKEVA